MTHRPGLIATFAVALLASFASAAADTYQVSAKLLYNGTPFGEPMVRVRADTPASVEVSGDAGYKLSITLSPLPADRVRVSAALDSVHGTIAPVLELRPGHPATVTIGELGLTIDVRRADS